MCAYFILFEIECTERRNRLRCGELDRSIVINKGEDMKRISQNLGIFACFRYIADNTTPALD
jgi:hypothetical protein